MFIVHLTKFILSFTKFIPSLTKFVPYITKFVLLFTKFVSILVKFVFSLTKFVSYHKVRTLTHKVCTISYKVRTTFQKVHTISHKVCTPSQKVHTLSHKVCIITHKVRTISQNSYPISQSLYPISQSLYPLSQVVCTIYHKICTISHKIHTSSHKVRTPSHKVRILSHKVHTTSHKVRTISHKVRTISYKVCIISHKVHIISHKIYTLSHKVRTPSHIVRTISHNFHTPLTLLYIPKINDQSQKLPLLVYFHGGAFCIETFSSPTYHNYLDSLVAEANVVAVSIEYRRAPEHPLPVAYDDCWAAVKWLVSHSNSQGPEPWLNDYADLDRLFFAGDSAGANLSHNMAIRAGTRGHELGSGLVDSLWLFVLGCQRVLVFVAEKDTLRDRGWFYHETLGKSGWSGVVEVMEAEGEDHVFHLFNPTCDKAVAMLKQMAMFLNMAQCNSVNLLVCWPYLFPFTQEATTSSILHIISNHPNARQNAFIALKIASTDQSYLPFQFHSSKLCINKKKTPSFLGSAYFFKDGRVERLYIPKITYPSQKLPLLIYFHGGGFCIETSSSPTYHNYLDSLVAEGNVVAVSVNYRRAPEDPLPVAYDDCWTAFKWVVSHSNSQGLEPWLNDHADFNHLFLAGDDAGANLAHNMAIRAGTRVNELGGVKVSGIILFGPSSPYRIWPKDVVITQHKP
ncbi:unnamed protein product, partial [Vitis vinifera]